jgi:hypothetical protein
VGPRPDFRRIPPSVRRTMPPSRVVTPRIRRDIPTRLERRDVRTPDSTPGVSRLERLQALQRDGRLNRFERRELRRLERTQPSATPAVAAARVTPLAAARGHFATPFNTNANAAVRTQRLAGLAPRNAWRRGWRASFVPWLGPVFWPYAYSDIFDYAFWPDAYDDGYWAYAYDDFFDGVFWASGSPYGDYAYGPAVHGTPRGRQPAPNEAMLREVCADAGKGVTAWPFAEIERTIAPTAEQRALLDELKQAAAKAAGAFKASCGTTFAMTPPGRLLAMSNRIDATLDAVDTVRPALAKFYDSLADEQKAHFNSIGPSFGDRGRRARPEVAATCGEPKPGLTNLPIERIAETVRPTDAQKAALDKLGEATQKAIETLQANCPEGIPLTPIGRLEVMEKRLTALSKAAHLVQPALDEFYASLSNEQKAQFNVMSVTASR